MSSYTDDDYSLEWWTMLMRGMGFVSKHVPDKVSN